MSLSVQRVVLTTSVSKPLEVLYIYSINFSFCLYAPLHHFNHEFFTALANSRNMK